MSDGDDHRNKKIDRENVQHTGDHEYEGESTFRGPLNAEESRTDARTVTVDVPSDYSTVGDALDEIREIRTPPGLYFDVNVESGHDWQGEVVIEDEDLRHVSITSDDATVGINSSNFASDTQFLVVRNANGPRLETVVDGGGNDSIGIFVDRNGTLRVEGGGAINFRRGIEPNRNAMVYCNTATFNSHAERGVSVTRNAQVMLEGDCEVKDNGTYNFRVGGTGCVSANDNLDATGATNDSIHITGYGRFNGGDVDTSGSGKAIDARGGHVSINQLTADPVDNAGVRCDGSVIDLTTAMITSSNDVGVWIQYDGGVVNLRSASITAQSAAVLAESPASVNLQNASVTNSNVGVYMQHGGRANLDGTTVTGHSNGDLVVRRGGQIYADNCTTSSSTGSDPHSSDLGGASGFNTLEGQGIIFAQNFESP